MNKLDEKLDKCHSILIRLKGTDENGNGKCFTCQDDVTYWSGQCGHYPYVSRGNMMYRWDLKIHKIQCKNCNEFYDGLAEPFRDRLLGEFGFEGLAKIEFNSHKPFKWFKSDKEQLLKEFRFEIRQLLKDKNFEIQIP